MKAKAPGRSSASLTLGFGMVNIPVKLYSGIEDSKVKRSRFTKDGHEVGMKNYDKETGKDVEFSEIVTKYRADDGALVDLTDDEIAAVVGDGNGVAAVRAMVPRSELTNYFAEGLMQVRPEKGKSKKSPNDKPFALFMKAMDEEDVFALVEFTTRGTPRYGALMPDGFIRVLAYDDEVREPIPMPEAEFTAPEMQMARSLVSALKSDGYVEVEDVASAKIRDYAETKAKGKAPAMEVAEAAPTYDLMAALEASIAQAKGEKGEKVPA